MNSTLRHVLANLYPLWVPAKRCATSWAAGRTIEHKTAALTNCVVLHHETTITKVWAQRPALTKPEGRMLSDGCYHKTATRWQAHATTKQTGILLRSNYNNNGVRNECYCG